MKKRQKLHIIKIVCLLILFDFATGFAVYSQSGVAINLTGTTSDPSAMLDVSSTNSGILIPRMTEAQKLAITNPAVGLMIYQTDGVSGFWYYDGSIWMQSLGATGATGATGADGATGPAGLLPSGTLAGNTPYWDGTQWVVNSSNIFNNGGSVGIGTNNPDNSAILDLQSTNKGFVIPRMTNSERNTIAAPAQGLQIFNTTTNCLEIYVGSIWQTIACGCNSSPAAPTACSNISEMNLIAWNWSAVNGAAGYKYNTINDYNSANDNGANTSFIQIALNCNTSYTLYVWAYNACGNSSSTTLTQTTSSCFTCGTSNVTFTYNGSSVNYGTVKGDYNSGQYCWLNRNLGATAVATAVTHIAGYGDLFQWGRLDDGHQLRGNSNSTTTLSTTDVPGHSKFIKTSVSPDDWRSGQNNSLWQGVSGINNPCPAGWRLPAETELNNERLSWAGGNNYTGAIQSALKLPASGTRSCSNGLLYDEGGNGNYWSSTVSGNESLYLHVSSSDSFIYHISRAYGFSVRCLRDY